MGDKPLPNGKVSNFAVELGSHNLLLDLEQGLIGVIAGQQLTLGATFPADYQHYDLAGKIAHFEIYVHAIKAPQLPALDSAFAMRLGIKDGDIEKLYAEIRQNLERELEQMLKNKLKQNVMDALYEANKIALPAKLINEEINRLQAEAHTRIAKHTDFKVFAEHSYNEFEIQARRRLSLN